MLMRRAQSILEYSVVITCVVLSLIAMQSYMRRGIQGRLRNDADSLGQPYEPGSTTSDTTLQSSSSTTTTTTMTKTGNVTQTTVVTNTPYDTEHRVGSETVN